MRVFLTGANGWIGTVVAHELLEAGHFVTGLVRSKEKGEAFAAAGGTPLVGSLGDRDVIRTGATEADGIIHTAFGLDFSKIKEMAEEERRVLDTIAGVFAGSDRPIIGTGGVLLTPPGTVFEEHERPPVSPTFPRASEQTIFALAERGLRASVVRNPRSVHGHGETHGFVPMLAAVAREKGVSAYVGDGENLWPSVHRLDAARVYRLALERGAGGEAYHAIAEEGVPYRLIAEVIGRQLGLPAFWRLGDVRGRQRARLQRMDQEDARLGADGGRHHRGYRAAGLLGMTSASGVNRRTRDWLPITRFQERKP